MIVAPRSPTRARLKVFADKRYSYLRALEYELIPDLDLRGSILDFGGGRKVGYLHLLRFDGPIDSLNIDPHLDPTILHDANTPFPIADAAYDTIISFNTLEHVRRDEFALSELVRILRLGGRLHIVVPFLYRVHASPSDYHRHTAFWWEAALESLGIPRDQSRIEPIMWGRMTTAFSFLEYTRLRFLRRMPHWGVSLCGASQITSVRLATTSPVQNPDPPGPPPSRVRPHLRARCENRSARSGP